MAKKPTKRKAFNFLRSYFDVLNELPNNEDKLDFLLSIINKQFIDEDPKNLNFITNLCYESQRHSVEKSVKGWKTANKTNLKGDPIPPPTPPPTPPLPLPPKEEEEKEQEKEQEKEKEKSNTTKFSLFNSLIEIGAEKDLAKDWIKVRRDKKASNTKTAFNAFKNQVEKSKYSINEILAVCVAESWKGFKSSWDISGLVAFEGVNNGSNEEIIEFNSNVNPTVLKLPKSQFLEMQEKNKAGGYIYKIIKR